MNSKNKNNNFQFPFFHERNFILDFVSIKLFLFLVIINTSFILLAFSDELIYYYSCILHPPILNFVIELREFIIIQLILFILMINHVVIIPGFLTFRLIERNLKLKNEELNYFEVFFLILTLGIILAGIVTYTVNFFITLNSLIRICMFFIINLVLFLILKKDLHVKRKKTTEKMKLIYLGGLICSGVIRLFDPILLTKSLPYADTFFWLYRTKYILKFGNDWGVVENRFSLYPHAFDHFLACLINASTLDPFLVLKYLPCFLGVFLLIPVISSLEYIFHSSKNKYFIISIAGVIFSGIYPLRWLFLRTTLARAELPALFCVLAFIMIVFRLLDTPVKIFPFLLFFGVPMFFFHPLTSFFFIIFVIIGLSFIIIYKIISTSYSVSFQVKKLLLICIPSFFGLSSYLIGVILIEIFFPSYIHAAKSVSNIDVLNLELTLPLTFLGILGIFFIVLSKGKDYNENSAYLISSTWIVLLNIRYFIPIITKYDSIYFIQRVITLLSIFSLFIAMFGLLLFIESFFDQIYFQKVLGKFLANRTKISNFNFQKISFNIIFALLAIPQPFLMLYGYVSYTVIPIQDYYGMERLFNYYSQLPEIPQKGLFIYFGNNFSSQEYRWQLFKSFFFYNPIDYQEDLNQINPSFDRILLLISSNIVDPFLLLDQIEKSGNFSVHIIYFDGALAGYV